MSAWVQREPEGRGKKLVMRVLILTIISLLLLLILVTFDKGPTTPPEAKLQRQQPASRPRKLM
jgi:hypothetical protein